MNSENIPNESEGSSETAPSSETVTNEAVTNETEATAETNAVEAAEPPKEEPAEPQVKSPARPRLNPTVVEQMKAVGTEGTPVVDAAPSTPSPTPSAPTPAPPEENNTSDASEEQNAPLEVANSEEIEKAILTPPENSGPVEIPQAEELDDDIEAQLASALAGEAATTSVEPEQSGDSPSSTPEASDISEGDRRKGKIQSVHGDDVFVDIGHRLSAVVSSRQFPSGPPEIGQEVTVKVHKVDEAEGLIYANLSGGRQKISGNWDEVDVGQIVDAMVTKTVKGGLEVSVSNLRGFMPAGQVDLGFVNDLEPFVEQKLTCQVIEVNPKKRNLVVSRRAYLQSERDEAQKSVWETLALGQQHSGTVKTIKDYGAFIDLGLIDGFLHVGEISWMRVHHPSDVLQPGQQVEVQIISLDPEKKRIGLGMRQLVENPWTTAENKYEKGKTVSGKVTRIADFGAFVELEVGVEGLIHISELDHKRIHKVSDVLTEGQQVEAQVLEVNQKKHRISLSLKSLIAKPEKPKKDEPEEEPVESYVRKRKGPLKGGIGGSEGAGLFGSPGDYK